MSLKQIYTRIFALALCLVMAASFAIPAMAATAFAYGKASSDNTPVYADADKTTVIGSFKKDDVVGVVSQVSSKAVYQVVIDSAGNIGYVSQSAIGTPSTKKASDVMAYMTAVAGSTTTTTTTTTGTTGGSAGYITNCSSYVNFRKTASATGDKISTLSKNAIVTVFEKTNGFYRVTNASGTTGYVSAEYVALGTPSASSSSSASSGSTGTISNCKTSVNWRATASTSGKKLGSLKKGAKVTVLGSEGDFYKISYNGKEGYVSKQFLTVSGGSSSSSTSGVVFNKMKLEPGKSEPSSTIKAAYDAAKKTNADTIGYVSINGTNIKFPILHKAGNANYYDSHDAAGVSAAKGAVHSFYNTLTRNNTITAHNQRGSNDMFHQLSHVFDKSTGKSTCQTTDYKCSASNLNGIPDLRGTGSTRQWDIYCFGYTKWEVWAMYKTEANEPTSTINNNIQILSQSTEAQINSWISTQKSRSVITGSADADDIFLTLYTCGTNFDSADAQSRIYIFLKAVK